LDLNGFAGKPFYFGAAAGQHAVFPLDGETEDDAAVLSGRTEGEGLWPRMFYALVMGR
jgi:hypothetical protein